MKAIYLCLFVALISMACNLSAQEVDAGGLELNGTWNRYNEGLTEQRIQEIRQKSKADPDRRVVFSWGEGSFNPNGSWYFDISKDHKLFYIDGFPVFTILSLKKMNSGTVVITIIPKEVFERHSNDIAFLKKYIASIQIHFKTLDRIELNNPDKLVFQNGGSVELYRLSGPN